VKKNHFEKFKEGLVNGIGWSMGVTVGFLIISSFLIYLLQYAGGLPIVGRFIADIIATTQVSLVKKSIIISPQ